MITHLCLLVYVTLKRYLLTINDNKFMFACLCNIDKRYLLTINDNTLMFACLCIIDKILADNK